MKLGAVKMGLNITETAGDLLAVLEEGVDLSLTMDCI